MKENFLSEDFKNLIIKINDIYNKHISELLNLYNSGAEQNILY